MEITYSRHGDYLLPNLTLNDSGIQIGRYGRMRRAFLREHRPIEYNRLLLSEQLFPHLRDVDSIAEERRKNRVPEMAIVKELVCE